MRPEDADIAEQALTLFHAGRWTQALPALRQAYGVEATAEVAAALGICECFSIGPLEPGESRIAWESLEPMASLLQQGEPTEWPEVSACQVWLQLLQESRSSPTQVPAALDRLVSECQQSRWFPVWALAFRALAYYDRRQPIQDALACEAWSSASDTCGLRLVLAEAALECAHTASVDGSLLEDFDALACLPLSPDVARLWHQWLLAEWAWWGAKGPQVLEQAQIAAASLRKVPSLVDDPYSQNEWNRLSARTALLEARCALSQGAVDRARRWIELASRNTVGLWESQYLNGLVAWSMGEHQKAQAHLQRSWEENPFQSRVRFELEMLLASATKPGGEPHLKALPGVHDTLSSTAVVLWRQGLEGEARHHLERLDQAEAPYSLRLICPQARASRICQGWQLRAHLAEANQDWLEALNNWDAARQYAAPKQLRNPAHRAHRLYLLGRQLQQRRALVEEKAVKALYQEFQKELGKLSIRPLTGEAMFYRGMAAEVYMPDRAISDWRALLRQRAWVERAQSRAPLRLLAFGDRLLRAGLDQDAHKAYTLANAAGVAGAKERAFASGLITECPFETEATGLLRILEAAETFMPDGGLVPFLRGLCLLALEPPDCEVARSLFEQAGRTGLPTPLERLGELLLAFAADEPDAAQQLCSFLDESGMGEETDVTLPSALRLGLEALCRPRGLETLRRFKQAFGANWMAWCPLPPAELVDKQLRDECARFEYAAALDQVQEAEELGICISDEWKAFLCVSQAVQWALRGDFEAAEASQRQALEILSPDQRKMDGQ